MALSVVTNTASLNGQRNLNKFGKDLEVSMQRLSSGMRINSAKDDAAGMQISNRLTSQINGISVAQRNANDGISISQTAEGAMEESSSILQRMRVLSLQSANGSNNGDDRAALQKEVTALQQEITRIAETTQFGSISLLDGTFGTKQFQVGANANETINLNLNDVSADAIGIYKIEPIYFPAAPYPLDTITSLRFSTSDLWTLNGESISIPAGTGASIVADVINNSGADVLASTKLEARIEGLTSADNGVMSFKKGGIVIDSYDLSKYSGNFDRLMEDLQSDGYEVIERDNVAGATSTSFDVFGVDVDGLDMTSSPTVKLGQLVDGAPVGALQSPVNPNNGASVFSKLELSSSDEISVNGGDVNRYLNVPQTGGVSILDHVDDIDISGENSDGAQSAIEVIDAALKQIDANRANLGAIQNRLNHTINNLANISENVSTSRSRIQDADFAIETAIITKNQILQQASTTVLAQANQVTQAAINLLG
ncbi:flagellin [Pseudoalteromonas sp. APC 3358]|uniref:flagellin n=1 Tax=Pseudoalteromonas sp. APC 3358 TaxID=3035176 RepID=UPI0025B52D89|nr:flagellin [Pseudoalteromonas sp. APC 3358]MDN3381291.1 flagellin [Pseudoalteromonas sp. APC 3358]